ncbi:MAG: hypothetical protein COA32_13420 [Fluviicola sp.]|nr:MAG: hypothetical protein COA32_13420 [Fluviicola sp.]|mmetsp:Transcript_8831/g.8636  ORF Transcript_8831/g.8636 Transcript_8831/m.8636 type:complete len:139 (-) Transcript_8831:14-430(-)
MKTIKILSLALLAMTFVLGSCSKYEEGPAFSLRTKKARLAGEWKADKYIDSNGNEENANDDGTIEFTKDNTFIVKSGNFSTTGTWEFTKDKEYVETEFTYTSGGVTVTETNESKILRLKNDELWLEDEDGDQTHYVPA